MIELVFLVAACTGIAGVARRRGSRGWPFVAAAAGGAFLVSSIAVTAFGRGPDILIRWAWIGLCYLATFALTGGGRRLAETWQCPECRLFNEPTTLVCPCGYRAPTDSPAVR